MPESSSYGLSNLAESGFSRNYLNRYEDKKPKQRTRKAEKSTEAFRHRLRRRSTDRKLSCGNWPLLSFAEAVYDEH